MFYIQHRHDSWGEWMKHSTYPNQEKAQEALDYLNKHKGKKPATYDGLNGYILYDGFSYRLDPSNLLEGNPNVGHKSSQISSG